MKTQRRHELQTNVLADWLGHQIELLRPYGKMFLIAAAVVALVVAAGAFLISDQSARTTAGWSDFFAASFEENPERLRAVAVDHAGTVAALWAQLGEADLELARGMRLLYTDRDSALESLKQAKLGYQQVDAAADGQTDLRHSARFGLGQVYECMSDIDAALDKYDEVAQLASNSALAAEARRRHDLLADAEVKRFYNWFANQKPAPPTMPGTVPGMDLPTDLPGDLGLLPDASDLSFPNGSPPAGDTPAATELGPPLPAAVTDAELDDPAATSTPPSAGAGENPPAPADESHGDAATDTSPQPAGPPSP